MTLQMRLDQRCARCGAVLSPQAAWCGRCHAVVSDRPMVPVVPVAAAAVPPGWYPDPWRMAPMRYWDGRNWTEWLDSRRPPTPEKRMHVPAGGLAYGLSALAVSLVLLLAVTWIGEHWAHWSWVTTSAVAEVVAYGTILYACRRVSVAFGSGRMLSDFGVSFRWGDVPRGIGWSLLARLGGGIVVGIIVTAVGDFDTRGLAGPPGSPGTPRIDSALEVIFILVSVAVIAPVVEEILFRGVIQRALENVMTLEMAILMQALIFGLAHVRPSAGALVNLVIVVSIATAGVFLGGIAQRYKRLGPSMVAHSAANLLVVAFVLART